MGVARRAAVVALGLGVLYVGATFVQVRLVGGAGEVDTADAIVVLGAAQYDGEPSPVLAARLGHALDLYADGVADVVVVTGGNQPGDRFTEAGAGAVWLLERGIPDAAIRREVQGASTWEQLAATARFLRAEGREQVVLVSDPSHTARLRAVADEVGLDAVVSPVPGASVSARTWARETAAMAIGRLVGFRRASAWWS